MRYPLLLLLTLLTLPAWAQLTLELTSVPANTPAGTQIYVAGSFNGWNPRAAGYALAPQAGGRYALTLPGSVRGAIEFKITLGTWDSAEATASGSAAPNRRFTVPATGAATYTGTVPAWTFSTPAPSTASPSVSILSDTFNIPQLGRRRRVWLYLPPDYAASPTKRYPVLYMHDGQNLFDARTSFSGEWGVDEALDSLQRRQGDYGCIVVGIDNGGNDRLNEYAPYVNTRYGGGQGTAYVEFIVQTLKPYIDARYRTMPDRLHTGIMGSSMGGLISLHALHRHPEVFGRAGLFSGAFWFNPQIYTDAGQATVQRPDPRVYLLMGGREGTNPQEQITDFRRMATSLTAAGYQVGTELDTLLAADGQHAEWFWRREFPRAYRFLFADRATALEPTAASGLRLYPNPGADTGGLLHVELPEGTKARAELYNATGRLVATARLKAGKAALEVRELPAGVYMLKVAGQKARWVRN